MSDNPKIVVSKEKLTKTFKITNCIWHAGDEDPDCPEFKNLPKDFTFEIEVDPDFPEDDEEILVDEITEKYGWLIEGLEYEEI